MGTKLPLYANPAEFLLDLTSSDFAQGSQDAHERILELQEKWQASPEAADTALAASTKLTEKHSLDLVLKSSSRSSFAAIVVALLHRSFIKSYRDVVAYGIRLAMYIGMPISSFDEKETNPEGLAIMMGTVWLRLPATQTSIPSFTNAIVSHRLVCSLQHESSPSPSNY